MGDHPLAPITLGSTTTLPAQPLPAPQTPKQHHRNNAHGDPRCHADNAAKADAAAGNGAGEQGRGGADRPTRHKVRRRAAAG
jgi:hypothetical protein